MWHASITALGGGWLSHKSISAAFAELGAAGYASLAPCGRPRPSPEHLNASAWPRVNSNDVNGGGVCQTHSVGQNGCVFKGLRGRAADTLQHATSGLNNTKSRSCKNSAMLKVSVDVVVNIVGSFVDADAVAAAAVAVDAAVVSDAAAG